MSRSPQKKKIGSKMQTLAISTSKLGLGFKTSLFRIWDLTIKSNIKNELKSSKFFYQKRRFLFSLLFFFFIFLANKVLISLCSKFFIFL